MADFPAKAVWVTVTDVLGQLRNDGPGAGGIPYRAVLAHPLEPDPVAEGHFHDRLGHSVFHRPGGGNLPLPVEAEELRPGRPLILCAAVGLEEVHRVARFLELGGNHLSRLNGGDGEGDQRGGHVQVQEGAGHRVLAADGRRAVVHLGLHGPQEGGEGLAPAVRVLAQLLEVLL